MSATTIPLGGDKFDAAVHIPRRPVGIVVFVHGSGVDRHDPRDRYVAGKLGQAGFATLQPELLDAWQARDPANACDVGLQCARLLQALRWLDEAAWAKALPVGFFGGGIGAGVALLAAAKRPDRLAAVVCRGGRPDSALFWLARVKAATLLLVEHNDWPYRRVYENLPAPKELAVVPSESGLFFEPEALEAVAQHAGRWFSTHLARQSSAAPRRHGG